DEDFEEGEGWLASLIPLRSDLLTGDLRSLYLGWLAGVQNDAVDEAEPEPPVPAGLRQLSAPLRRLIDFLRLDSNLFKIAAAVSGEWLPSGPGTEEIAAWVAELALEEKNGLLVRLMQGEGIPVAGDLLRLFREEQARKQIEGGRDKAPRVAPRTAG